MTEKFPLHEDVATLERRAEKLRAEAVAEATRRSLAWIKSLFGAASGPGRSKTA